MPKRGTLQKVIMEFVLNDGTVVRRTLKGEAAQEWDKALDGLAILAHSHRMNPDWSKFTWEEKVSSSSRPRGRRIKQA